MPESFRRRMRARRAFGILIAALLGAVPAACRAEHLFTNIVDTNTSAPLGNFSEFGGASLSGGLVSFDAWFNGTFGSPGISSGVFTSTGGSPTTIAKKGDPAPVGTWTVFGNASPASGSETAFVGIYSGNSNIGIYKGSGGALTPIVNKGDPAPVGAFLNFQNPTMRGNTVAFQGAYSGGVGVFTASGGALTTIAKAGDAAPVGTFSSFGNTPGLDVASVAFLGRYAGDSAKGIFLGEGGALTTVATTDDAAPNGTFTNFDWPSLSDGTAAFRAFYPGGQGIFTGSGGALTTIAKTGDAAPEGTFTSFLFAQNGVSISGNSVVFQASYGNGSNYGIFLSRGGAPELLLGTTDPLFGSTVSSVDIGTFAADGNQVAFRYILSDGRRGIAVVTVPEPSTYALGAVALVGLLAFRKRKTVSCPI